MNKKQYNKKRNKRFCTIQISCKLRDELNKMKRINNYLERESYNDLIKRLLRLK